MSLSRIVQNSFVQIRIVQKGAALLLGLAAPVLGCRSTTDSTSAAPAARESSAPPTITTKALPMLGRQPLLNAKLDITSCPYELYVNGGLVSQDDDGLPAREEHPINHWLRSGENEIALHLMKAHGEPDQCEAKVSILLAENGAPPGSEPTTLFEIGQSAAAAVTGSGTQGSTAAGSYDASGRPAPEGPVRLGPVNVHQLPGRYDEYQVVSRTFELPVPFPEWAFFKGERQKPLWEYAAPDDAMPHYQALLAEYDRLRKLLS